MRFGLNPLLLLAMAALATVFAVAMWYGYARPRSPVSATGTITDKTFLPAHAVKGYFGGARRENWTEWRVQVPDSYLFQIHSEQLPSGVQYSLPVAQAKRFAVGQKVSIQYVVQGIPGLSRKIQVTQMSGLSERLEP